MANEPERGKFLDAASLVRGFGRLLLIAGLFWGIPGLVYFPFYSTSIPRDQHVGVRSPLLVENGKLHFFQPNWTYTILDVETGNVLLRDDSLLKDERVAWFFDLPDWGERNMLRIGNMLVLENSYLSSVVVDRDTGGIVALIPQFPRPALLDDGIVYCDANNNIVFLDALTGYGRALFTEGGVSRFRVAGGMLFAHRFLKFQNGEEKSEIVGLRLSGDGVVWERIVSGEVRSLESADDRLFVLTSPAGRNSVALICLSLDGEELWRRTAPHPAMNSLYCEDGIVYIGQNRRDNEPLANDAYAFTFSGNAAPAKYNAREVSSLQFSGPENSPAADMAEKARVLENAFADEGHMICHSLLPDGGLIGIFNRINAYRARGIEFRDAERLPLLAYVHGETRWSGAMTKLSPDPIIVDPEETARYLTGLLTLCNASKSFVVTATADSIVYSVPGGRMECVDRATGASRWVYCYSRSMWKAWNRDAPKRSYPFSPVLRDNHGEISVSLNPISWKIREYCYLEDFRINQADVTPPANIGLDVEEEHGHPAPAIIVDPKPVKFITDGVEAARFVCRYAPWSPVVALCLVVILWRSTGIVSRICLWLAAMLANLVAIGLFGLFSRESLYWMSRSALLSFFAIGATMIIYRKPPARVVKESDAMSDTVKSWGYDIYYK